MKLETFSKILALGLSAKVSRLLAVIILNLDKDGNLMISVSEVGTQANLHDQTNLYHAFKKLVCLGVMTKGDLETRYGHRYKLTDDYRD